MKRLSFIITLCALIGAAPAFAGCPCKNKGKKPEAPKTTNAPANKSAPDQKSNESKGVKTVVVTPPKT